MPDIPDILKALIAIIVLINPLEGIPLFLARTAAMTNTSRLGVAKRASLTVLVLLLGAMAGGKAILYLFGIQIATFTIAGGIIILLIALKMVLQPPKTESTPSEGSGDIAIVPLGTPLLAGPGPISSVIVFSSKGIGPDGSIWISDAILLLLIALAATITYLSLRMALPVGRWLGQTGINVLTRLAGILVAAIALQMILSGLLETFPAWK
ncbi:MAG: MarC family protein [Verrucomicrobiota bacterium]